MNGNNFMRELVFFSEAWICLLRARMILTFRPFNKIAEQLKNGNTTQPPGDLSPLPLVMLSITRASKKSPWRTKCFEQALAARMMLKRRGISTITYFGVLKNTDGKIEAHAWLKCGDVVVTGWKKINDYEVLHKFH